MLGEPCTPGASVRDDESGIGAGWRRRCTHFTPRALISTCKDCPRFRAHSSIRLFVCSIIHLFHSSRHSTLIKLHIMGAVPRPFDVIEEPEDDLLNDLVKHGNADDQRDMARMGKMQEMRVSVCAVSCSKRIDADRTFADDSEISNHSPCLASVRF